MQSAVLIPPELVTTSEWYNVNLPPYLLIANINSENSFSGSLYCNVARPDSFTQAKESVVLSFSVFRYFYQTFMQKIGKKFKTLRYHFRSLLNDPEKK